MKLLGLSELERQAFSSGLLLRVQVNRPMNIWTFKIVVAREFEEGKIRILGEMKGWAYQGFKGLQLDTMRVNRTSPKGIGHLIWAATMAWAIENTPCRKARLLAIYDSQSQHAQLTKYFYKRGGKIFLEAANPAYDPIELDLNAVVLQGKLLAVWRKI